MHPKIHWVLTYIGYDSRHLLNYNDKDLEHRGNLIDENRKRHMEKLSNNARKNNCYNY